jgi:hypothetical protein
VDDEAVALKPKDVQVATIALQIRADLLVEQQVDFVEAVLVAFAQVVEAGLAEATVVADCAPAPALRAAARRFSRTSSSSRRRRPG